jgi:hypothetical protein
MNSEILAQLPKSFQLWQRIEELAEQRAEARLKEILTKEKKSPIDEIGHGENPNGVLRDGILPLKIKNLSI